MTICIHGVDIHRPCSQCGDRDPVEVESEITRLTKERDEARADCANAEKGLAEASAACDEARASLAVAQEESTKRLQALATATEIAREFERRMTEAKKRLVERGPHGDVYEKKLIWDGDEPVTQEQYDAMTAECAHLREEGARRFDEGVKAAEAYVREQVGTFHDNRRPVSMVDAALRVIAEGLRALRASPAALDLTHLQPGLTSQPPSDVTWSVSPATGEAARVIAPTPVQCDHRLRHETLGICLVCYALLPRSPAEDAAVQSDVQRYGPLVPESDSAAPFGKCDRCGFVYGSDDLVAAAHAQWHKDQDAPRGEG